MTLITTLLWCAVVAGPFSPSAPTPAPDALLRWMDRIAQQELDKRESAVAAIHTTADAERRKKWVRETLLDVLGGLPDYDGPLQARITGRLEASSYTIEK